MRLRTGRFLTAMVGAAAAVLLAAPPAIADSIRDRQWHLAYLNVAQAQALSQGEGVTVAVVDTGVNGSHPDLEGNVLPGVDVSGAGAPDGQSDVDGHGTGMAALIAGHGHGTGNGDGVLGIAPRAKIYPVRDVGTGTFSPDFAAAGVEAAVRSGAKVISISQGGDDAPRMRAAIQTATAADIVVVVGMGNKPERTLPSALATYDGVVAVGATDQDGNVASIGVTGSPMVLSAPGTRIVSADKTGYAIGDGTSASTAIVAGAAALIRSKHPNLSAKEVVHRLTATATDKGPPGRDPQYGYGIVNLVAALTADVPPLTPSAAPTQTGASAAPTVGATTVAGPGNKTGPGNKKSAGSSTGTIVVASTVVGIAAAGITLWALLRRRRQRPTG